VRVSDIKEWCDKERSRLLRRLEETHNEQERTSLSGSLLTVRKLESYLGEKK